MEESSDSYDSFADNSDSSTASITKEKRDGDEPPAGKRGVLVVQSKSSCAGLINAFRSILGRGLEDDMENGRGVGQGSPDKTTKCWDLETFQFVGSSKPEVGADEH